MSASEGDRPSDVPTTDNSRSAGHEASDESLDFVYAAIGEADETGRPVDVAALIAQAPDRAEEIRQLVRDSEAGGALLEGLVGSDPPRTPPSLEVVATQQPGVGDVFGVDGGRPVARPRVGPDEARQPAASRAERGGTSERSGESRRGEPAFVAVTRLAVEGEHDAGGFGLLLKGRDLDLARQVAIKVMPAKRARDGELRDRFRRESQVTGQLLHPGIVPVYARGETGDGRPFYVMPFLEDGSLAVAIDAFHADAGSRYDPSDRVFRDLLSRFASAAKTVAYAHNRGVVHRDLKPQNIMLGRYGETLVIDWGLAETTRRSDEQKNTGEAAVQIAGSGTSSKGGYTPQYASPEQIRGDEEEVRAASDIYSLGATLYKVVTGGVPVRKATHGEIRSAVLSGEIDSPRERHRSVPRPLDAIVRKAMSLDPADRYGSGLRLAEDIEAYLADQPISAQPDPPLGRLLRVMRQDLTGVIATIVALALLASGLIVLSVVQRRATAAVEQAADEHLELSAQLAAELGGREIDRRWLMLEADAADPELRRLVRTLNAVNEAAKPLASVGAEKSTADDPTADDTPGQDDDENAALRPAAASETSTTPEAAAAREELFNWVSRLYVRYAMQRELTLVSLNVYGREGTYLSRVPPSSSVGRNFAYRAYFHGGRSDQPIGTRLPPSPNPVLSPVFVSTSTGRPLFTLAVPIWAERTSVAGTPELLGRLTMSVDVGDLALFDDLRGSEVPLLVEAREYELGGEQAIGTIADHPRLDGDDAVSASGELQLAAVELDRETLLGLKSLRRLERFRDPIDGFEGPAVAVPILVPGRPPEVARTGWVVILHPAEGHH